MTWLGGSVDYANPHGVEGSRLRANVSRTTNPDFAFTTRSEVKLKSVSHMPGLQPSTGSVLGYCYPVATKV